MKKIATVVVYQDKKFFGIRKGESLILLRSFRASILNWPVEELDGGHLTYEMMRKKSVIMTGDIYKSSRGMIFRIKYSEISYEPKTKPAPTHICAKQFDVGDELFAGEVLIESDIHDYVMVKMKSIQEFRGKINDSTLKSVDSLQQMGIATSPINQPEVTLAEEFPGGILLVNDKLL